MLLDHPASHGRRFNPRGIALHCNSKDQPSDFVQLQILLDGWDWDCDLTIIIYHENAWKLKIVCSFPALHVYPWFLVFRDVQTYSVLDLCFMSEIVFGKVPLNSNMTIHNDRITWTSLTFRVFFLGYIFDVANLIILLNLICSLCEALDWQVSLWLCVACVACVKVIAIRGDVAPGVHTSSCPF